jgi:hypothetical protein
MRSSDGVSSAVRRVTSAPELRPKIRVELMADHAMGESEPPAPAGDRRADLRAVAEAHRALVLRHPWLAGLPVSRPVLGPNGLAWLEATCAAAAAPHLEPDEVLAQVGTLLTFVRGHVVTELAEHEAIRRSRLDMTGWLAVQARYGETIIGSGRYPQLSRIMLEAETPHADDRSERAFRRGLEHVLAGLSVE